MKTDVNSLNIKSVAKPDDLTSKFAKLLERVKMN